jgi:ABC-type nickel/cobalt efflux system permease component RcnA
MRRHPPDIRATPKPLAACAALWRCLLCLLLAISMPGPASSCAFHFADLPEASLSQQIAASAGLIAARPAADNPFRFGAIRLLKGAPYADIPPHLVDSATRRRLGGAPDNAVLFARDPDGTWVRLLMLDETTAPVISHMIAQADRWASPGGDADRRDFAAGLLAHSDQRLVRIGLRELDALDYRTLRAGSYATSPAELLEGIFDLQEQAYVPIRILLLGIVGSEAADAEIARQLAQRTASGINTNLGAWTTAALELRGAGAIAELERSLAESGRPLSREQTDEIVRALAVQATSGDAVLRGPARLALLRFVGRYPDASFFARAQAVVTALFTGAMTDMKAGATTAGTIFAFFIAFLYGAIHTLGPGHGKAVVISYFVGSGGTLRRGILMGTEIAIAHVLSAIVIVFLLDFAVRQTTGNSAADYRSIRLASYGAIALIGGVMLLRAVQAMRAYKRHDHAHSRGCASCAAAARKADRGSGWLATAIGVVPCTGALIVMLYGLANGLVVPAIVMVIAISLGMAFAMAGIGLAAIWGHNRVATRWTSDAIQRLRFALGTRLVGAAAVLFIGAALFVLTLSPSVPGPGALPYGSGSIDSRTAQVPRPAGQ